MILDILDSPPCAPRATARRLPARPVRPSDSTEAPLLRQYEASHSSASRWSFSVADDSLPRDPHLSRIRASSPPAYDPHFLPRYAASSSAASFSTIRTNQEVPEAERDVKWSDEHYGRGPPPPVRRHDSGGGASFNPPSTLPPSYHPDAGRARRTDREQTLVERGRQCASPTRIEWPYASLPDEADTRNKRTHARRDARLSVLFALVFCLPRPRKRADGEGKQETTTVA